MAFEIHAGLRISIDTVTDQRWIWKLSNHSIITKFQRIAVQFRIMFLSHSTLASHTFYRSSCTKITSVVVSRAGLRHRPTRPWPRAPRF